MADKDRPKDVMRSPYIDGGAGKKIRIAVSYSQLTDSLKDRLGVDLTVHELQEMAIATLDKILLCLYEMSDLDIIEDDIVWPT
ncbi:hypothetical protein LCGC14_2760880 [marine sediment metagenome]|uniref:Uncharacterized protein n=1 Tax=marine sediment metagenome TaxID=412755 RepID=A0A0F8YZ33_9ZZZZ